jgi:hypothetical protein
MLFALILPVGSAAAATPGPLSWSAAISIDGTTLRSVSCPSVSFCVAADALGNIFTSTNPTGGVTAWTVAHVDANALSQISCASSSLCVAVDVQGNVVTSTDPTGGAGAWTVTNVDGTNILQDVWCASASQCVVLDPAGNVVTSSNPTGGSAAWTVTNVDGTNGLHGVSCPSTSLCVVVDNMGNVLTSTNPTGGAGAWTFANVDSTNDLHGVSCPSVALCAAVDARGFVVVSTNPSGGPTAWTATTIDATNVVHGVSCSLGPQSPLCVAGDSAGSVVASTDPTGGAAAWAATSVAGNSLQDVSCPSALLCVAVGQGGILVVGVATPPTSTSAPSISGSTLPGQPVACSPGSWSGSTPQAYGYQWLRDGANISGAVGMTYIVAAADQGHTLACVVTATNNAGSTPATSSGLPIATSPATSIGLSPTRASGNNGWYVTPVRVAVSATVLNSAVTQTNCVLDAADAPTSFGAMPAGCAYLGTGATVSGDGLHTLYAASVNTVGEQETPVSSSFKIDLTAPQLACVSLPTFTFGMSNAAVFATVSDAASGPASATVSARADVSSAGAKIVRLTGFDNAGNSSTVTCGYTVQAPGLNPTPFIYFNFEFHKSFTIVRSMVVTPVPALANVRVSCAGHGCPFKARVLPAIARVRCRGKRCEPRKRRSNTHTVQLTSLFRSRHLAVGAKVTVAIVQRNRIEKVYRFRIRSNRKPSLSVVCLSPGLNAPAAQC